MECARELGRPSTLLEALTQRAMLNLALGDGARAQRDIDTVHPMLEKMDDPTVRACLEPGFLVAEIEVERATGQSFSFRPWRAAEPPLP